LISRTTKLFIVTKRRTRKGNCIKAIIEELVLIEEKNKKIRRGNFLLVYTKRKQNEQPRSKGETSKAHKCLGKNVKSSLINHVATRVLKQRLFNSHEENMSQLNHRVKDTGERGST
jgi:hypothetical protein